LKNNVCAVERDKIYYVIYFTHKTFIYYTSWALYIMNISVCLN